MRQVVEMKKKKLDRMNSRSGADVAKLQELEKDWYDSNTEFEQVGGERRKLISPSLPLSRSSILNSLPCNPKRSISDALQSCRTSRHTASTSCGDRFKQSNGAS